LLRSLFWWKKAAKERHNGVVKHTIRRIPPPAVTDGTPAKLDGLLPVGYRNAGYYHFPGSLTTPPCTGNITFFLLKTPIKFSAAQIAEFARRYPMPNAGTFRNWTPAIENR